jgi:NADPH:quinone reductase-like Zn-dependent oxidoreductase
MNFFFPPHKTCQLSAFGKLQLFTDSWPDKLGALLKQNRTELAAVIDAGGDEIMVKMSKYLKHGGRVVCYGMTAAPTISITMREVMRNQQLIGAFVCLPANFNTEF